MEMEYEVCDVLFAALAENSRPNQLSRIMIII